MTPWTDEELREWADSPNSLAAARVLAARWVNANGRCTPLDENERKALFAWVQRRMAHYVEGASKTAWAWSRADEGDLQEMAEWISLDLFLDHDDAKRTARALCEAAGWP